MYRMEVSQKEARKQKDKQGCKPFTWLSAKLERYLSI